MKAIDIADMNTLRGIRLNDKDKFRFRCHEKLDCFNLCCRNLNLFLYPYDVLRLKKCLSMSSEEFLEKHTDIVLRKDQFFPEVLLRMADNTEKTCPFLTDAGCSVYSDRPDTCRSFPIEQGVLYEDKKLKTIHFFRPPEFCQGQHEDTEWTPEEYAEDQHAERHHQMTALWAEVRALFQRDPYNGAGPDCPKGKMAFMAAYNIDRFREFIFGSSFLKRYKIKANLLAKLKRSDTELLKLGFDWIKFYLWGIRPAYFSSK